MQRKQTHNIFLNLMLNIITPVLILTKFSTEQYLGPVYGLIIALAFPFVYGIFELLKDKRWNFLSILGVISILLTGGIGLLQLDNTWLAVKEGGFPLLIGLIVLASMKTKYPLVKTLLYNNTVLKVDKIHKALQGRGQVQLFEKYLRRASYYVAGTFFFSAFMNYTLTKIIVVSEPGSVAYAAELGKLTALSYPVIALPSVIMLVLVLFVLLRQIKQLTRLKMEELVRVI